MSAINEAEASPRTSTPTQDEVAVLRRQRDRERARRRAAEAIGEQVTSDLVETVARLHGVQAEMLEVADRTRVVTELARELRHAMDVESLLERAAHAIGRVTCVDRCQVFVSTPDALLRDWGVGAGPGSEEAAAVYRRHLEPLLFEGAPDRRGVALRDVELTPHIGGYDVRPFTRHAGMRAVALVPVWGGAQLIGCVTLMSVTPRDWGERDLSICEELARDIGLNLMQLQAHEQQRQVRRLEELDRDKDAFISNVSHELRTPLSSINGYLELITEGDLGPVPDQLAKAIAIIDRNAGRLHRLVEDMLAFSTIETDQVTPDPAGVDVARVVEDCHHTLSGSLAERRLQVRIDVARDVPRVRADRSHVERVVRNVLANAIKFTPDEGQVTVTVAAEGDAVRLIVDDTGIGIPEADLSQVGTRFFRSSLSTAMEIQGTGLGLALAKALVGHHGGTIRIASIEGAGTTVVVTLPVVTPTP
ncbi:MAG: GAF domain-containing sensor histidine kinase [Nocardioides sp.]